MNRISNFLLGLLTALVVLSPSVANATHVDGAEITYRYIDTLTYEVDVIVYRYCGGIALSNPSKETKVVCTTSGKSVQMNLRLKSISDLDLFCSTYGDACISENKARSGSGIERFVYRDTVDFRSSKYSGLVSAGCTDLRFEIDQCCRNSGITTGAANSRFYTYSTINLKHPFNSSPTLGRPVTRLCCNQPVYHSIGANDLHDFDSLSFDVVNPQSGWGKNIKMNVPPFTVYYSGTYKYPYGNINANPPIGFNVDPTTGWIVFTPTKCDEVTNMAVEVTEWRKDTSGKYAKIGTVRRDMMYTVSQCAGNNPPRVKGSTSYSVCEGEKLCFTVTTEDKVKIPPPPLPKPDADTSTISWDEGIPWASFKVLSDTVLNQSAQFCWTPKVGRAKPYPYRFTVSTRDDQCPTPGYSSSPIEVWVYPAAKADVTIDSIGCSRYAVKSEIPKDFLKPAKYKWLVLDNKGNVLSPGRRNAHFESTGIMFSTKETDTLVFETEGTYIIEHEVTNQRQCARVYRDTITVGPVFEAFVALNTDTFHCEKSSVVLHPSMINSTGAYSYLWQDSSTADSLKVQLADTVAWDTVWVEVTDKNGCVARDQIDVIQRPNPTMEKIDDTLTCRGDSLLLRAIGNIAYWNDPRDEDTTLYAQGSTFTYDWYYNYDVEHLGTADSVYASKEGNHRVVITDSLGCQTGQVIKLVYAKLYMPSDQDVCINDGPQNLRLLEDSRNMGGKWYCPEEPKMVSSGNQFDIDSAGAITSTTNYTLYYDYKLPDVGCTAVDSIQMKVHLLPQVRLKDIDVCQEVLQVDVVKDGVIQLPAGGALNLGRQFWSCVDCGTYDAAKIIEDLGTGVPGAPQKYVFNVDPKTIPLGSKVTDEIRIELAFQSVYGCFNRDTMTMGLTGIAKLSFGGFKDLCWGEDVVDLDVMSGVSPAGGIWRAVDSTGYAPAKDINKAISGDTSTHDTLDIHLSTYPGDGKSRTYILRYYYDNNGCPSYRDTTLVIHGKPGVEIDRNQLDLNSNSAPFQFCELDPNIQLLANYSGGTWSTDAAGALSGSTFRPSKVVDLNKVFFINYDYYDINGCYDRDSVGVEVHPVHTLKTMNDTSLTWTSDNMELDVWATYEHSPGITWIPLSVGTVDDNRSKNTTFRFSPIRKDTITFYLLYVKTDEGGGSVCPFTEATIQVHVHPTPCSEFDMNYDVSSRTLKLVPKSLYLASYKWEVGDTSSTSKRPTFDVSGAKDSIVLVKLTAFNELGDSCVQVVKLNVKNGSVRDLKKQIKVYPNPVSSGFRIDFDGYLEGEMIQIYGPTGALVVERPVRDNWVDCSQLAAGVYTFVLQHDRQRYLGRFVKQ
ncbi:MAG: T9SS type A sorting domain-containing protein [Bacteroidia bacterium]|nr:T9SS type A sorting domain-containing protein [Bacteroidia bacterium]